MEKVLCKDCKFSKASLLSILFRNQYGYTCKHEDAWYVPAPDNILGVENQGYFRSCSAARMYGEKCGPNAKNWVPKDTSKVFIFLKRV